jgi:hypothetical protein
MGSLFERRPRRAVTYRAKTALEGLLASIATCRPERTKRADLTDKRTDRVERANRKGIQPGNLSLCYTPGTELSLRPESCNSLFSFKIMATERCASRLCVLNGRFVRLAPLPTGWSAPGRTADRCVGAGVRSVPAGGIEIAGRCGGCGDRAGMAAGGRRRAVRRRRDVDAAGCVSLAGADPALMEPDAPGIRRTSCAFWDKKISTFRQSIAQPLC